MRPGDRLRESAQRAAAARALVRSFVNSDIAEVSESVEVVERRTMRGKVFDFGNGVSHLSTRIAPVHFKDNPNDPNETWKDIDLTISGPGAGGMYRMSEAFYSVAIDPARVAYTYNSKRGPDVAIELERIGGAVPDYSGMTVEVEGNKFWWRNVAPGVDIYLLCRSGYAELFKVLYNDTAPRVFRWQVTERNDDSPVRQAQMRRTTEGWENDPLRRNRLEIANQVTAEQVLSGGRRRFLFRETWSGRVSRVLNAETRQRAWFDDPVYPVTIDLSVTENIANTNEDGTHDVTWQTNKITLDVVNSDFAIRFTSVPISAGATISAATLTMRITTNSAGGFAGTLFGNDVDDAPQWSGTNLPGAAARTTASTAINDATTGLKTYNVLALVQEVFGRGGWANNNNLGIMGIHGSVSGYMYFEDYEAAGTDEAQIDITYTTATSAALTGTVAAGITEDDVIAGGKTIILTLTGDTWVTAGATFDAQRQAIIDGIDSAQSEANGWDAVVKATQGVSGVVRTSNTVATITLDAFASYNITVPEIITATIPATALTGASPLVATPTFNVSETPPPGASVGPGIVIGSSLSFVGEGAIGAPDTAAGQTVVIGRVTESEAARTLTHTKARALGRVTELETARALIEAELHPIGRVIETESARALSHAKARSIGRVNETESARTLAHAKALALGRVTELESARALTEVELHPIGRVTELESARALTHARIHVIGRATEIETARALTEIELHPITRVTETETARELVAARIHVIGRVTELESARSLTEAELHAIGRVTETETAHALTHSKALALGRVTELESARPITSGGTTAIGRVTEQESARALAHLKVRALGRVTELESARALTSATIQAIGRVTEAEQARALAHGIQRAIGRVTESEIARPLTESELHAIGRVVETESASALSHAKALALGRVAENEIAGVLTSATTGPKFVTIGRVTESEQARALVGSVTVQYLPSSAGTPEQQWLFLRAQRQYQEQLDREERQRKKRKKKKRKCDLKRYGAIECEPVVPSILNAVKQSLIVSRNELTEMMLESDLEIESYILRSFGIDDESLLTPVSALYAYKADTGSGVQLIDEWFEQDEGQFIDYLKKWAPSIAKPKLRTIARALITEQLGGKVKPETTIKRVLAAAGISKTAVSTLLETAKPVAGITETIANQIGGNIFLDDIAEVGVKKWQWKTVHDDLVDDVCQELDGEVFDIDVPFEKAHPNCRCFPAAYDED